MTKSIGVLADPQWRRERAKKASAASHSVSAAVRRIVENPSELTDDERALLTDLLRRK